MATKVGAIYVEIKGDDTQWKKDMSALRSAATKSGKDVSEALNSAINPSKASSGIKTISTGLTQLAQTAKAPEKQFKQTADAISDAFDDVAKSVGLAKKEFSDLNERMLRNKAFQTATNELKSLTYAAGLSVSETKKLAQQMGYTSYQAGEMANKIHRVQQESNATVDVFSRLAVAAVAAFSIHEIVDFTNKIKDAGVEVESLGFAYASITGSQSKAAKEMEYVSTTAKSLGLGLTTLEKSYKGLLAASQGTSLEGENTRKIFTSVSKASAVLGLSADQTAGALLALEQMMSKGTVQSEELRGQLGERIPGAFNKAAEAMGVTTAELSYMLKQGEVIAEDFLPKFAAVLERDFGKAAEDAGGQARAAFENFSTAVIELKRTLAESGILEYLAKITRNATGMINEVNDAINSFNAGKMKTSVAEYDAALTKAKTNLSEFTAMWGNTRDLVPDAMKERFDDLTDAVEVLSKAKDNLSRSLQNDQDWQAYGKEAVKTFGKQVSEADKAAKDIEAALKKSYEKGTEYLLAEKKKQLAIYMQYEGRKPEYVAQLQSEIAALEKKANASSLAEQKKANASSLAEQKKATAAYKKELDEQKSAVESFNEEHKKATLSTFDYEIDKLDEWYNEQNTLVEKGLISRQDLEETYAEKWFEIYDDDVADFVDAQQEKTDAVEKEKKEILKLEKEAYEKEQELIKAGQEAYDKLYEKAYDFTRDVIDDFDSMGDTLVDLAEKMVKDIAAAFLTQTIVMPVYMYAANSLGFSSLISSGSGVSGASSLTGTVAGAYDLYSAYGATTGGTTNTIASILGSDAVSSVGTSVFGSSWGTYGTISDVAYIIGEDGTMVSVNAGSAGASYSTGLVNSLSSAGTAGIISSLAYTYLGDMVGLPQGEYSGIGAGVGGAAGYTVGASLASGASSGAASGSWAGPIGAIIGAIVGGVASSFIGDDTPDYRLGLFPENKDVDWTGSNRVAVSDNYDYMIATQDYDVKNAESLFDFYDAVFEALDEVTTASINDIILNADTGDYGRIGWFDPSGMETEEILTTMTTDLFKALRDGLVEDIGEGFSGDVFSYDFFESIQSDEETLLDTYLGFRDAVETLGTAEFLEQFTYQMEEFGLSASEAYANMGAIANVVREMADESDALAFTNTYTELDEFVISVQELDATLQSVHATTQQLNDASDARNRILGAEVTGLTAETIQQQIISGGDLSDILSDQINDIATSVIAQDIYTNFIESMNEDVGKVFAESDYDLNVLIEYMQNIDTSEAQAEITALQVSFGLLEEELEEEAIDTSAAVRRVTLAIDGQLTAAQQFEEWQIDNAEALALYTDTIAGSVTRRELEGAVDAFVDLGIEGDQLNDVIGDLADRFTDATNQILDNISNIESAQGNLSGDDSSQYASKIASVLSYFQTFPTMAQIRGDETITKEVFNEEDFNRAVAEYVVDSEFQNIFGRNASGDYWVDALLNGDVSFSGLSDAIIGGISNNEDFVTEIFTRLFGRTPASSYWVDALDSGAVTRSNIEAAILAGATGSDLTATGRSSTRWVDFDTAAAIAGILEEDYYDTQKTTMSGEFSTSEAEVLAAMAVLQDLPEVIINGVINDSALTEFVDTLVSMDASVLEDIFGADAASQINTLADAVSDYYSAADTATSSTSGLTEVVDELADATSAREDAARDYRDALQDEIDILEDALSDAKSTYLGLLNDELSAQEDIADSMRDAVDAMKEFRDSIWTGENSPYGASTRGDLLYKQVKDLYGKAMAGDTDAMSDLIDVSSQYLDVSKETSAEWSDYQREAIRIASMLSDIESYAGDQATGADAQVAALQNIINDINGVDTTITDINIAREKYEAAQLDLDNTWMTDEIVKLDGILESNKSIAELMKEFIAAQKSYLDLGGEDETVYATPGSAVLSTITKTTGVSPNALVSGTLTAKLNQMIDNGTYSPLAAAIAASAFSTQIRDATDVLSLADSLKTTGFATGGSFSVAGASGLDTLSLPNLRVTAGEMVNITRGNTMESLIDEMKSLRSQVAALTAEVKSGNVTTRKTLDITDKWDKVGTPTRSVA